MLFFLLLIMSIGSGAFHPCAVSSIANLPFSKKSALMVMFVSGGYIGLGISQTLFSYIFQFFGQKTWILIFPVILLFVIALFHSFPFQKKRDSKFSLREMFKLFKHPELSRLYFSQILGQSMYWGLIFVLPEMMQSYHQDTWLCFGGGHLCLVAGGGIMMIPVGYLADRFSPKKVLMGSISLGLCMLYIFLWAPLLVTSQMVIILLVLGACLGIMNPLSVAWGQTILPSRPGVVGAFLMGTVWAVSELIGHGGIGVLSDFFGGESGVVQAIGGYTVLLWGSLLMVYTIPESVVDDQLSVIRGDESVKGRIPSRARRS